MSFQSQHQGWRVLADDEHSFWPLSVKVWTADSGTDDSAQFGLALYYSPPSAIRSMRFPFA